MGDEALSPWWRRAVPIIILGGFAIPIWLAFRSHSYAPPVPEEAVGPDGRTIFTGADIRVGQQVFIEYGLMENGTIWGHGAYVGPDFSAQYLHDLALDARETIARTAWPADQELAGAGDRAPASDPKPDRFSTLLGS